MPVGDRRVGRSVGIGVESLGETARGASAGAPVTRKRGTGMRLRRFGAAAAVTIGMIVWWATPAEAHPDNCTVWAQWPVHAHLVCT